MGPRPLQTHLRARKRGEMPSLVRGWQTAGPSGIGSMGQTHAQPSFLAGDFGKPYSGPLYEPQTGHSPRGAKAYAQCRTGPRRTPRRVARASLTAPCTTLDPLRLKRKGKGCRLDRPPQPGTEPASSFSRVLARGTPPSGPCWHGCWLSMYVFGKC